MNCTMNCTIRYANGRSHEDYPTIQAAMTTLLAEYPEGYAVDAGGFAVDADTADSSYDVRAERAAMIWANEADSQNDDGVRSVAVIEVEVQ